MRGSKRADKGRFFTKVTSESETRKIRRQVDKEDNTKELKKLFSKIIVILVAEHYL